MAAVTAPPPREDVEYYCRGTRLSAHLYPPGDMAAGERAPGVVFCPGFTGVKTNASYPRWVEPLVAARFAVLVPDHRGWGESDGEEGAINPFDQVEDIRAALTYLETRGEVDADRLGVAGVSFGGGNAVYVAAVDDRVRAAVSIFGVADGRMWLRGMRREYEWRAYLRELREDRRRRTLTGTSRRVDPTEEIMVASPERRALKGSGARVDTPLDSADAIIDYRPVDLAGRIAPRALLLMCMSGDPVVPAEHSRAMFDAAGEPRRLVVFPGDVHYEGYQTFEQEIVRELVGWMTRHVAASPRTT